MSFGYTDTQEQSLFRESVQGFAIVNIENVVPELNRKEQFSVELVCQMGTEGYLGIMAPPIRGGMGLDYLNYITIVEELAGYDSSCAGTVAAHNSLGVGPILYFGTLKQQERFLPQLCRGEALWAFGLTEPGAGSDVQNIQTRAEFNEKRSEWVLRGSKIFITNGSSPMTAGITVLAKTGAYEDGKPEFTCFLVPVESPGLEAKSMHGKGVWRASNTAELYFDDVRVPADYVLGKRGDGFKIMMSTLDRGRLSIAAMGLGIAKRAYALSLEHAKLRHCFGKPIAEHQTKAFTLAEMAMRITQAEFLLYNACQRCQGDQSFELEAAMAKLLCSRLAEFCTREGTQIFGGYGLMEESLIWRLFLDTQLLRIGEGTDEMQQLVIARRIGCFDRSS